jgi:hypothetical protein
MHIIENIGVGLMGLVILGTVWVIFNMIFNGLLSCTTKRFKLPVQKRFKGKMTPIHELGSWSDGHEKHYWVTKWELQYSENGMCDSWHSIFIPFYVLFSRMQYVRVGTHKLGVLTDKEVLKLDIALEWHKLNQIQREKELAKEIKSEEFQSMIDYINKDFKQNYTE